MNIKEKLKKLKDSFKKMSLDLKDYIKSTDIVGIANMTLLSFLFVFFSILTFETINAYKSINKTPKTKLIVVYKNKEKIKSKKDENIPIKITKQKNINCKKLKKVYNRYGNIIVDGKNSLETIKQNENLIGNLYIQNIYNYTLPCDVSINGNLFLRNIGKLKFCGKFTITGNIYITENVSFGNFPKGSKLEGNIIF